jgi:predicted CoA-binding protein
MNGIKITTLVLGASDNPARYSFQAISRLRAGNFPVVAIGNRQTVVADVVVHKGLTIEKIENIHTVSLYLSPSNQTPYQDFILALKPQRVIFNPNTENPDFQIILESHGIKTVEACTLVMIATGQYDVEK